MFLQRVLDSTRKCKTPQQCISDYGHIAKHNDGAEQTGPWANARQEQKALHSRN